MNEISVGVFVLVWNFWISCYLKADDFGKLKGLLVIIKCIPFLKNQTRLLKKLQEIYLWHVPQTFVISKTVHIYKQLQIISISHTFRQQVLSSFSQHIRSRQLWYSTVVVWRPFGCNFLNAQSLILLATGFKDNPNTPYL